MHLKIPPGCWARCRMIANVTSGKKIYSEFRSVCIKAGRGVIIQTLASLIDLTLTIHLICFQLANVQCNLLTVQYRTGLLLVSSSSHRQPPWLTIFLPSCLRLLLVAASTKRERVWWCLVATDLQIKFTETNKRLGRDLNASRCHGLKYLSSQRDTFLSLWNCSLFWNVTKETNSV